MFFLAVSSEVQPFNHRFSKEDVARAMRKAADASDGEDSGSDTSSNSSAASSRCDLQSESPEKVKKRKRGKQAETPDEKDNKTQKVAKEELPEKPPKDINEEKKGKQPRKRGKDGAQERIEAQLVTSQKVLQSVTELTPDSVWRSLIRQNELERRLSRASSSAAELEKVMANSNASEEQKSRSNQMKAEIERRARWAGSLKEVARTVRSKTAIELANIITCGKKSEFFQHLSNCATFIYGDMSVMMDIMQNVSKKLLDAPDTEVLWSQLVVKVSPFSLQVSIAPIC